ncbi:MFS transporter [Thermoanaerobacterium sp. CMT5567-10]|uniref:MFS transporter n=1 Tax=Thermoanaerobacterium sp. CMT5567-10 TaxID=3061989 RepID=UPI0026DFDA62|nr:MFS transporter [Thermoanaerobacterium sp. CMT5567-10]WKV07693.1 MFS transporter [Thermoanaerobacterium sp. CMT5567-10]
MAKLKIVERSDDMMNDFAKRNRALLSNSNFMLYIIGYIISGIGTRLTTIALSSKILYLTNSGLSLSATLMLEGIPSFLLGLFAGNVVDKMRKKNILVILYILFAFTSFGLIFANDMSLIYIISFINGILTSFEYPARSSIIPLLVDKDHLLEANSIRSSLSSINMIVGYSIGGIIVSIFGNDISFLIDSLTFIIIAILIAFIRIDEKAKEGENENIFDDVSKTVSNIVSEIKQGIGFIKGSMVIRQVINLNLLSTLIISMQTPLVYIFVKNYLDGEKLLAARSGMLFSLAGVGGLIGGILINSIGKKFNNISIMTTVLLFDGITLIAFSNSKIFLLSSILFTFLGVIFVVFETLTDTIIQENTNDDNRGKVYGFLGSLVDPLSIISLGIGGALTSVFSAKAIFILCGISEITVSLIYKAYNKVKSIN